MQQKLDVIALYKQGMGCTSISKSHNIDEDTVLRWVERFDCAGVTGLTGLTSYGKQLQHFDTSFKLKVIHWLVRTNSSYPQAARHFNLPSPSIIWTWKKRYDALGVDGLSNRRKRKVPQMNEEQLTPEQEIK